MTNNEIYNSMIGTLLHSLSNPKLRLPTKMKVIRLIDQLIRHRDSNPDVAGVRKIISEHGLVDRQRLLELSGQNEQQLDQALNMIPMLQTSEGKGRVVYRMN